MRFQLAINICLAPHALPASNIAGMSLKVCCSTFAGTLKVVALVQGHIHFVNTQVMVKIQIRSDVFLDTPLEP